MKEIVKRSVAANEADWSAFPQFTHNETDVELTNGKRLTKTYENTMVEGSPYQRLIRIDGQPLSAEQQQREDAKLQKEITKRQKESESGRAARLAKYRDERDSDHLLMKELVNAFDFKLSGEERVNGIDTWVLDATPKAGYKPINGDAKVLTGMKGRMWIDKSAYHWVRVSADVTRPVTMRHFAKVGPGTRFTYEQQPILGGRYWMPRHFLQEVNAKILGLAHYGSRDEEFYSNYRSGVTATAKAAHPDETASHSSRDR